MRQLFYFVLIFCIHVDSFSQKDTNSVYNNLEYKKNYKVNLSTRSNSKSVITYKVNDKIVDKTVYDKYYQGWINMSNCCPCILQTFDENNLLLREAVSCTDCFVGEYKEYYPSGNLKIKGKFKENGTGDWKDISDRGYCNIPDGTFLYYKENKGLYYLNYVEIWKEGEFIEQKPDSKIAEIWKIDLLLNDTKIDTQSINIKDIKNIKIVPKYKNKLRSLTLNVKISISAVGFKFKELESSIETFKDIDFEKMLNDVGVKNPQKANLTMSIYDNTKHIKTFILKLN